MNKKYLYIFLFLICCYFCFFFGQYYPKRNNEIIIRRDTLVIRDTTIIEKPVEKIRWKEKEKLIYIPIRDTSIIIKNDTTYLVMEEEKVKYEGEDYEAIISGVHPKLEQISVYPKTVYITEKQTEIIKKHWRINISAGPGIFYNGKFNYGIGVICGFGYSF